MHNNTYFGGGGGMRDHGNCQGVDVGLNDHNTIEMALQHQIGQQLLSPTIHDRNDSMFSCSSMGGTPRHSISRHQAEAQPRVNPHSPNGYSQLPVSTGMSRSTSQYSSTSSGQRSYPHSMYRASCGSFGSNMVSAASNMSRSISSTSASQRTAPQPYSLQSHPQAHHFQPRRLSNFSPNMEYRQFPATEMNPFDYGVNDSIDEGIPGREGESRIFGHIGYNTEQSDILPTVSPISRTHAPFGEHAPSQNRFRMTPPCQITRDSDSQQSACSSTRSLPVSPQQSNRRRRHTSGSSCTRTDPIIGQVTLSGKFKCLNEACLDDGESLTFNRHADFKRHHENTHARRVVEYFCPEPGCPRSRNPAGGTKLKGFRGRKDKMNEHRKAVHHKEGKRRKRVHEGDDCAEEQDYEDSTGARKARAKRTSSTLSA